MDYIKWGDWMANAKLLQGDCLELMKTIPDKSIDLILCDLPYQTELQLVVGMQLSPLISCGNRTIEL